MDSLRLMTVLVAAMLGGGMALCALIASMVLLVSGICTRLFRNNDYD